MLQSDVLYSQTASHLQATTMHADEACVPVNKSWLSLPVSCQSCILLGETQLCRLDLTAQFMVTVIDAIGALCQPAADWVMIGPGSLPANWANQLPMLNHIDFWDMSLTGMAP